MTRGSRLLVGALAHGMELSWLSAWAVYTGALFSASPFPLAEALLALLGASLLTRRIRGRGWLVLAVLGAHAAGLCLAAALFLRPLAGPAASLAEPSWLLPLLTAPRPGMDWLRLGLRLAWLLGYWLAGVGLARRPIAYGPLCARFDVGLGCFFGLFLIRWAADTGGGVPSDPLSPAFVFPFLISGLTAIGTSRLWGDGRVNFLPGSRGAGILLLFATAALLSAAAAASFLLPALTLAAEAGLVVLRGAGTLLGPPLLWLLRLLFAPQTLRVAAAPPSTGPVAQALPPPGPRGGWLDWAERILGWTVAAAAILAGLLLLALLAYGLWRFLLSRTPSAPRKRLPGRPFRAALDRLRAYLAALLRPRRRAADFYAALLGWARRGGQAHPSSETPAELAGRLRRAFPGLAPEIGLIVEAFQVEVYGELPLDGEGRARLAAAWGRLRSPRHWPARLRRRLSAGRPPDAVRGPAR